MVFHFGEIENSNNGSIEKSETSNWNGLINIVEPVLLDLVN